MTERHDKDFLEQTVADRPLLTRRQKIGLLMLGASAVVGEVMGIIAEGHTNEVAARKADTAQYCLDNVPHERTVNQSMIDCMHEGAPGQAPIQDLGPKHKSDMGTVWPDFKEGQPLGVVDTYIDGQHREAEHFEVGRMVAWPAAPLGAVAAVWLATGAYVITAIKFADKHL